MISKNNKLKIASGLFLLITTIVLFTVHFPFTPDEAELEEPQYQPREAAEFLYGINTNKYLTDTLIIKGNQTFFGILTNLGIKRNEANYLTEKARDLIDLRKLKKGESYTVFCSLKNNKKVKCMVYEPSPTYYILIDFRDSITIERVDRKVERKTILVDGKIKSSLYQTMMDQNISPNMVMKMADIYASTIDFFRVQKGDHFSMMIEDDFVEGRALGTGNIKAVWFNHSGKDYYAFYYAEGDVRGYFDEMSNAMKKQFLRAPLKFSNITSKFTMRRFHPVLKVNKPHLGTDYAAPKGTPVMTVANGVVVEAKYSVYNGNYVKVKHNNTYTTQYLHFSKIKSGIKPGVRVTQGDVIGYVGSTGLATGPHVCFRFWKNGKQSDPFAEKNQFSEPLPQKHFSSFKRLKDEMKAQLDSYKS